jgi:hypothetical protein
MIAFLVLIGDLTPYVPLSVHGEGEGNGEGLSPLSGTP